MAPKKKARAKKRRDPQMGHNSDQQAVRDELLKIARAQKALDKRKADARAEFKTEHDKLTGRLKEIGISRQAFKLPYDNFCGVAAAENDDDARRAIEDNKLYLAQQRIAYDALGQQGQIDWVDLVQDAEQIQKLREEADRKAAEEAAAGGDDPKDTAAQV